jgi:hypothetical protein
MNLNLFRFRFICVRIDYSLDLVFNEGNYGVHNTGCYRVIVVVTAITVVTEWPSLLSRRCGHLLFLVGILALVLLESH